MKAVHPTISYELIGPEEAYDLLVKNHHNRNQRPTRVEAYARDMMAGRWQPVGEPIQIAEDGMIINGQHRLMAVIEADCGQIMFPVIRGLDMAVQAVADQGAKRTFGDVLKLQFKETESTVLAAAVRQLGMFRATGEMGLSGNSGIANPSISELTDVYLANRTLSQGVHIARALRTNGVYLAGSAAVALHYLFTEVDPDEADPFFERVKTGTGLDPGNAILAYRRQMIGRDRPTRVRPQAALTIKAFNYWRSGKTAQYLRWRMGGSNPDPFPTIEPAQP